jgi:putative ABC transport system substrate-binding protein
VIVNPTSPTANSQLKNLQAAAGGLGLQLHVLRAGTEQELDAAFTSLLQRQAGGLVFTSDPFFANRSQKLAALAARHRVPAIHQSRDFAMAGGLTSYGGNFTLSHRLAGVYAGRVIKGEKPSDLPVQQVTSIELFINVKAANALGITVPPPLLGRADVVIE